MKLLIITQKVHRADTGALGFFHSWIIEFAKHAKFVTVICLEEGKHELPDNVKVLSLGKEKSHSRIKYLKNFYTYIWRERKNYDVVFVHMNQEYVLLAGWWWRLVGKKVLLWRNHKNGTYLTNFAASFCNTVFCTSPASYTARFKKTKIMPAGIDIKVYAESSDAKRTPSSILSLGRISVVKNIDVLVRACALLDSRGVDFSATIAGDTELSQKEYHQKLLKSAESLIAKGEIVFKNGMTESETAKAYKSYELFVNLTSPGSLDKTILEAMLSGALVIVCNTYFRGILPDGLIFEEGNVDDLAHKIKTALSLPQAEKDRIADSMKKYVIENHSLEATINKIMENI